MNLDLRVVAHRGLGQAHRPSGGPLGRRLTRPR
jgi:hypothetical protein